MRLRIRLGEARRFSRKQGKNRHIAGGVGALLNPASLVAATFGAWIIAADLGIASQFAITQGFFSHWQVWAVTAAAIKGVAWALDEYARRHEAPLGKPVGLPGNRNPANPLE